MEGQQELSVDMKSHHGVRGLCALWILIFHCVHYGSYGYKINLNGSVAMPIFFILSGFSLTVVYGKRCDENNSRFNKMQFYRNRFARIYPVYFLTICIGIGLFFTDFGYISPRKLHGGEWVITILLNVLLINMWVMPARFCVPINGPAWFVSVLWFQYLVFPFTLPLMKRIKRKRLCISFLVFATWVISGLIIGFTWNFNLATMNIISPGFCMFHAGALLAMRVEERLQEEAQSESSTINEVTANRQNKWAKTTDICVFMFMTWLILSTIFEAFGYAYGSAYQIQIFGSPLMLSMILSLSMDGGRSKMAKFCRLSPSVWLGQVAMSVYLIHELLIRYWCVIIQPLAPHLLHLTDYSPMYGGSMPYWLIIVIVPLSLLLGMLIEQYIERPGRAYLRAKPRPVSPTQEEKEEKDPELAPMELIPEQAPTSSAQTMLSPTEIS